MHQNNSEKLSESEAYYRAGVGHANAVKIVHHYLSELGSSPTDSTWVALQNLIGLAVEISLKAYLCSKGIERAELRKFKIGHNLETLLEKAVDNDLAADGQNAGQPELVDAIRRYVALCGADYVSFQYRYLEGATLMRLAPGEATLTVVSAVELILEIAKAEMRTTMP